MGHQQHRLCFRHPADGPDGPLPVFIIQSRKWLVQGNSLRRGQQRPGQGQTALHASGPRPHRLAPHICKAQFFQHGFRRPGVIGRSQGKAEVARRIQPLQQAVLLKNGAPTDGRSHQFAAVWLFQTQQDPQQGGLSHA